MVRDDIDDDLHVAAMGLVDESVEVLLGAVAGIDRVIVLDGVGTSLAPFLLNLPYRMQRHEPKYVNPEFLQVVELCGDAIEISGGREGPRKDLVDDGGQKPGLRDASYRSLW